MDISTVNEQGSEKGDAPNPSSSIGQQGTCEKCGQSPCICPTTKDVQKQDQTRTANEQKDTQVEAKGTSETKKPPKIRWI